MAPVDAEFETENIPTYMIVMYGCIGTFGVFGNIVICIVIATNKSMHTVTNCYLFNLAISDIVNLVSSFPPLDGYAGYRSEVVCKMRALLAEGSVYASTLTISAFSIERYLAICHPFLARQLAQMSRSSWVILIIWICGLLCAIPLSSLTILVYHYKYPDFAMCSLYSVWGPFLLEISSVVFFVIPMLLMGCLYTIMGVKIRSSGNVVRRVEKDGQSSPKDAKFDKSTKHVIRMLVTVVAAFFICWAPFHLQRLSHKFFREAFEKNTVDVTILRDSQLILTHVSSFLSYGSAIINPILYNVMSNKFRQAFKDTFVNAWSICSFSKSTEVIEL